MPETNKYYEVQFIYPKGNMGWELWARYEDTPEGQQAAVDDYTTLSVDPIRAGWRIRLCIIHEEVTTECLVEETVRRLPEDTEQPFSRPLAAQERLILVKPDAREAFGETE